MASSKLVRKTCAVSSVVVVIFIAAMTSAMPQRKASPPKTLRLYVFDCGNVPAIDVGLFNFTKEELTETRLAIPCYLVVHPKGTLMWDVGAIPDTAFKKDGVAVVQNIFHATKTLKSQLLEIGYAPSDITYLALSHYHRDHSANANEFVNSTWLVRQVERDAMFGEKVPDRVNPQTFNNLKNSKTKILTTDEYDVFGDASVIIKFAPGHTPGHQVLILKLAKTGNVMISGDLYHYPEERTTNKTSTFEYNVELLRATRAMVEDYVKKTNTQLWIEHDFAANAKLRKSPAYYE